MPPARQRLTIETHVGSILDVSADAIVVLTDTSLTPLPFGEPDFADAAGPAVAAQVRLKGLLRPGQATHTRAGFLPFLYVIHAAVAAPDSPPTVAATVQALYNSIRLADELDVASVALPAPPAWLGPADEAARELLAGMAALRRGLSSLQRVVIAAPDAEVVRIYKALASAYAEVEGQ